MSIRYYEEEQVFHIKSENTSYLIGIADEKYVGHMYYGRKLDEQDIPYLLNLQRGNYLPKDLKREKVAFEDTFPWEFGCPGLGDFHEHCIEVYDLDGNQALEFFYQGYQIYEGKKALPGLPGLFGSQKDCQTLELTMIEYHLGLELTLVYTVFPEVDVISRYTRVKNVGDETLALGRLFSLCFDLRNPEEYDWITLHGAWGRERAVERRGIAYGKQNVSSVRGVSSHQLNPFMAIVEKNATEDFGEVYGFNFVYSGNFMAQVEKDQFSHLRAVMGIHPYQFAWELGPDAEFVAPEVTMTFSAGGIGQMSRNFHDCYRRHLIRGKYAHQKRPVLINNWEATYFDFNTDKLISIASEAAKAGIEMLVMDDGWFGKRNSDDNSLGDWFVNEEKLPGGLAELVDKVNELGMKFGIWMEPEMVNPDSKLYLAHSDWALQSTRVESSLSRNQLVLDFSRKEVRDGIYEQIRTVLKSANIEYVKWDMNRSLTNVASRTTASGELYHRYMLGVYELQERLITDFPDLLLENCSSGGGRYDAGMLYYSPQIWCSDCTDAIERLEIQWGTAMVYPLSTMGAHVSDCPNHATGRTTSFATRGQVALAGTFGYELDVTKIAPEQREQIKGQVKLYHKYNNLIREGDYYRIASTADGKDYDCYMVVSKDKKQAVVSFVRILNHLSRFHQKIRLKGLDEGMRYHRADTNEVYYGSTYMNAGIEISGADGDFAGQLIHLTAEA